MEYSDACNILLQSSKETEFGNLKVKKKSLAKFPSLNSFWLKKKKKKREEEEKNYTK